MDAVQQVPLNLLEPGSVVEIPTDLVKATGGSKLGIFMGGEITTEFPKGKVLPYVRVFRYPGGAEFELICLPPQEPQSLWTLKNTNLSGFARRAFKRRPLNEVPYLRITCGTDPEIFAFKADGTVLPAWEYLQSEETAERWYQKTVDPEEIKRFWDGVQAEFCPPAGVCLEDMMEGVRNGLKAVREAARQKDNTAELGLSSTAVLSDVQLLSADPKNLAFRCSPSFNVYGDCGNDLPDPLKFNERYSGGHIHLGTTRKFTGPVIGEIVRALDGIVGIAGVSLAAGIDDPRRRRYYGRAGEFRLPEHGLEYRVLSNFWLSHPAIAHLVFGLFRHAAKLGQSGLYGLYWEADQDRVRDIINNCDVAGARAILKANRAVLATLMDKEWPHDKAALAAVRTIENGLASAIKDPADITGNWLLNEEGWIKCGKHPGGSWLTQVSGQSSVAPFAKQLDTK